VTLSIVARDKVSGDFGVCGYTDIAGYGSLVPHVSIKGAVATQAYVNVDNGIELLEMIENNLSVKKAGSKIINKDKHKNMRQMIAVGLNNSSFSWTGEDTLDFKNSISGNNFIVAGNCMTSNKVLEETAKYFEKNLLLDFPLRLINAIQVGDRAGGHIKKISYLSKKTNKLLSKPTTLIFGKSMSSALLIASKNPQIWHNLRVDAHKHPIKELKKIYFDTVKSANKLNKFYNGAIRVKPLYWRRIIQ
jgi:uncharacterized Ntn-hydrolase superfamily protein